MSKEIELKLTLPPEAAERFCEHSFLAALTSKHRHLYNTYPDFFTKAGESRLTH